jgi:hypothetical protein
MKWKPRLLSLEESILWIVVTGFLFIVPACLYGYGLRFRSWKESADLAFFLGMFIYGVWSAIVVSKRSRNERIQREVESSLGNNR